MMLIQYTDLSRTVDAIWTNISCSTTLKEVLSCLCGNYDVENITIAGNPVAAEMLNRPISELPLQRLPEGKFYIQIEKNK